MRIKGLQEGLIKDRHGTAHLTRKARADAYGLSDQTVNSRLKRGYSLKN